MSNRSKKVNRLKQIFFMVLEGRTSLSHLELLQDLYKFRRKYGSNPDVEEMIFIITDIINNNVVINGMKDKS